MCLNSEIDEKTVSQNSDLASCGLQASEIEASRFRCFCLALMLSWMLTGCARVRPVEWDVQRNETKVDIGSSAHSPIVTYRLKPPEQSELIVESGSYFHPFHTPKGVVVTDFAPSDHKHHRGIFLGFVEMHGAADADFWGWGAHAPIKGRKIVNRDVTMQVGADEQFHLTATNEWQANGLVLVDEVLDVKVKNRSGLNVMDLVYRITPKSDLVLSRWAFSGFCFRTRKDGEVTFYSPTGVVTLPDPSHVKPETDWADALWYAAGLKLPDGTLAGAAVMSHPSNPATLWHNNRGVRMINPCIVAPSELKLRAGVPLILRYRVVAFDGGVPSAQLTQLAREFQK